MEGYVSLQSLSTICYLIRNIPLTLQLQWLELICQDLTVAWTDNDTLLRAWANNRFHDLEDKLQDCCAQTIGADYIVTANIKDFRGYSVVPAVTPEELLTIFNNP